MLDGDCRATVVVYAQRGLPASAGLSMVDSLRLPVQNNSIVGVFGGSLMAWERVRAGRTIS